MSLLAEKHSNTTDLRELLEEIQSLTAGDQWRISLDQTLVFLRVGREEYYRYAYNRLRVQGSLEIADYFSPENVEDLIFFLQDSGYPEAGDLFFRAGYYFSEAAELNWMELFISVAMSRVLSKPTDREQLELALAGCLRFQDAARFYCEVVYSPAELINFAVDIYLNKNSVAAHALSRSLLRESIQKRLDRRFLRWEDIFQVIHKELLARALLWNLLRPGDLDDGGENGGPLNPEIQEALRVLDLPGKVLPGEENLKSRYRSLMKKYHPDVNSEGLEKARCINEAYALVTAEIQYRARVRKGEA